MYRLLTDPRYYLAPIPDEVIDENDQRKNKRLEIYKPGFTGVG